MQSPTFVLVREYHGRYPLYHADLFRLETPQQLAEIGFDEFLDGRGVTAIEWARKIPDYLPESYLEVIVHVESESHRRLECVAHGQSYAALLEKLS